jgi:S-adenosylmethionine:tRNA ribosyltransferase-isomerase
MKHPRDISISDYTYELPPEKIASHPLSERDASKLLIYNNGKIKEDTYSNIDAHIPQNSLLVFNNSKVINARIRFKKSTGTTIEIFCLEPAEAPNEYATNLATKGIVKWKCLVGGISKWKDLFLEKKIIIEHEEVVLKATLIEKHIESYIIEFQWYPANKTFAEVLEIAGDIPLPPYIKRATIPEDSERYQTVYARHDGSVAAPTAGLHFTDDIFNKLSEKNISKTYITLHVGAGTFKPVKAQTMFQHEMHAEWIEVDVKTIKLINLKEGNIIAVGTTSIRTIETLYWLGVKILLNPGINDLHLNQWDVYEKKLSELSIPPKNALEALAKWLDDRKFEKISARTKLIIAPGYEFKIVKALITNFHQPKSTLLLLVAAAIGDHWKKMYIHALQNEFRFLSYGDGNLLFIDQG